MRRISLFMLAAVSLACGGAEEHAAFSGDQILASPIARVGQVDGPGEYLFGRIVGIAVGRGGVTYVADAIGSSVRAYNRNGEYLTTIGSEGDGPGEFRNLLGLDIDPIGDLVVRGAFRLSMFREPSGGAVADSLIRTVPIQGPNPDRDVRGRAVGRDFYGPSYFWEDFQRRGYFYLVYDSAGTVADTVFVPPFPEPESTGRANYPINAQGGRNVEGINRAPFEPRPSWDVDEDGHIFFAAGERYEIIKVEPEGDTLLTIRHSVAPRPVPETEGSDSARAFNNRLDSVPVPLTQVRGMSEMARARQLPDVLPQVVAVQVDERGNVWVRRWPRLEADESIFDVFDGTGRPLWQVEVPATLKFNPSPWLSGDQIAGVVVDPATGVETVAIFSLSG